jgi:hypothetical protein
LLAGDAPVASPDSAYSAEANPVYAACGDVTHLRALPAFESRVAQFALSVPASECHGFSPWQLRPHSFGAAREQDVRFLMVTALLPALAADPLRPSAEGAAPYGATSDAPSCHPAVLPRELQLPRSPRTLILLSSDQVGFPPGRGSRLPPWD